MMKVETVEHDGDFRLRLRFSDGSGGLADLAELVARKPLAAVRKCFAEVEVVDGAVEWPNGEDIATETLYALAHGLPRPTTLGEVALQQQLVGLREVRRRVGKTILKVSDASKMNVGELSRFERRDDHKVSTLRRYVEALGGQLEVSVIIDGERVRIM